LGKREEQRAREAFSGTWSREGTSVTWTALRAIWLEKERERGRGRWWWGGAGCFVGGGGGDDQEMVLGAIYCFHLRQIHPPTDLLTNIPHPYHMLWIFLSWHVILDPFSFNQHFILFFFFFFIVLVSSTSQINFHY